MHHCLRLPELLRIIATFSDDRALFFMTLTCRTFYESVDEVLWRDLPGLRPLLSLLPEDTYIISKEFISRRGGDEDEAPGSFMITRVPRKEEWKRVQERARRVRNLFIPSPDRSSKDQHIYTVSYSAMDILHANYPEPVLFPNLRLIKIEGWSMGPCRKLFTSPCLQIVHMEPYTDPLATELDPIAALNAVSRIRDLQGLAIKKRSNASKHGLDYHSLVDALSRTVLRQTRLRLLSAPSHISEQALVHIERLPSLEILAVGFYAMAYRNTPNLLPTNFVSLRRLNIDASIINGDVSALTSFLGTFARPSPLMHLDIKFTTNPNDVSLPDFFIALSQFRSLDICKLTYVPASASVQWDGPSVSSKILKPLHRIKGMLELNLAFLAMDVSPDSVEEMAAAWPKICNLSLGQLNTKSTPSLTLEDIIPVIARNCPDIGRFGASFRSGTRPDPIAPPSNPPQHQMTVDVGVSPLHENDLICMRSVLEKLLPRGTISAARRTQ